MATDTDGEEKGGATQFWVGSASMCVGIIVSAVSYSMANVGDRYFMLWGTIALGLFAWCSGIYKAREDDLDVDWRTAAIALALPIVLGGVAYGVVTAMAPEEVSPLQAQMDEIFNPATSAAKPASPAITIAESTPTSAQPGVQELISIFENNPRASSIQCEMARRLGEVGETEKAIAAVSLMSQLGAASDEAKICVARAMKKLEPTMAVQIYDDWSKGDNQMLKDAALKDRP